MRTFYFFLIYFFLTFPFLALPAVADEQDFYDNYYDSFYGDDNDFGGDSEYMRYIKGIYSPYILERIFICRKKIKKMTSISGSVNLESWKNKEAKEKNTNILGEVAIGNDRRGARWKYSLRAKTDLSSGGAIFSLSKNITPNLKMSLENELMQDLGLSGVEYSTLIKLRGTFNPEKLFNWFKWS